MNVLLVDGDASLRHALRRAIRLAGCNVEDFASIEALLARGIRKGDNCLVLDVDVMDMERRDFSRALERICHELPTILISALAPADSDSPSPSTPGVEILYKPFDKSELVDAIRRCAA